jgi:hypothetical protein
MICDLAFHQWCRSKQQDDKARSRIGLREERALLAQFLKSVSSYAARQSIDGALLCFYSRA